MKRLSANCPQSANWHVRETSCLRIAKSANCRVRE